MTSCPVTPLSAMVATCLPATGSMMPSVCSPLLATRRSPPAPSAAPVMCAPPATAATASTMSTARLFPLPPPPRCARPCDRSRLVLLGKRSHLPDRDVPIVDLGAFRLDLQASLGERHHRAVRS